MERPYVNADKARKENLERRAAKEGGLCRALWALAGNSYDQGAFSDAWDEIGKIGGKKPNQMKSVEEFWNPQFKRALIALVSADFERDMREMTDMLLCGQFSSSMWRRSYHSADFGYYASHVLSTVAACIYLTAYEQDTEGLLYCQHDWLRGYTPRLALELRRKNPKITSLIREAMLGDNQTVLLTTAIIRAIIISGNEELIDILLKLLVAARLQEGLRQQILENADAGSTDTLIKILKVCIDEDMFRYSSATRAFDTWTGLGYGDAKPAVVKKCADFAYECLTDEKTRKQYLESENNLEAYLALWAAGCHEIETTDTMARRLLDDGKKYRRILGWMFVSHTDSESYRMHVASQYLGERDEEILAWVVSNLAVTGSLTRSYFYGKTEWKVTPTENPLFPGDLKERRFLFAELKKAAEYIGGRNKTFTGNPFAFSVVQLSAERVLGCMMSVAGYDMDEKMVEELTELLPLMSVDERRALYGNFMEPERKSSHRAHLREALNDRSVYIKELAVKRLSKCSLQNEDLEALAGSLRSKSSSLRKAVLTIFREQPPRSVSPVIGSMLSSGEDYQIQAGIELLLEFKNTCPSLLSEHGEALAALRDGRVSTQTSILLKQLEDSGEEEKEEEDFSEENGFGLYDPLLAAGPAPKAEKAREEKKGVLGGILQKKISDGLLSEKELKAFLPSRSQVEAVLGRMNAVFERHADYEYEVERYDGSREKVLFGDAAFNSLRLPAETAPYKMAVNDRKFCMIPFHEEFAEALGEYGRDVDKLLGLCYVCARYSQGLSFGMENQPWFDRIESRGLSVSYHGTFSGIYKGRYWQMMDIIALLPKEADSHELYVRAIQIYRSMVRVVGEENLGREYQQKKKDNRSVYYGNYASYPINHRMIGYWRTLLKQTDLKDEDFGEWFLEEHYLERLAGVGVYMCLGLSEYFRACDAGLIAKDALYERLLVGSMGAAWIRSLTGPARSAAGREILDTYPWAKEFLHTAVNRIVEVEQRRGELPTPLTPVACAIERFEGAVYFCNLLAALGRENFFRGYSYSMDTTKRSVLSRLLKRCYPAKSDTPDRLKELLKQTDIKEKRLVEAVMYAPQWAAFAEEITGWTGLKCGVWFFHAHINETFSAEKETEVALYSPITPRQFNDGAFDKDWFWQAYNALGEKRFRILYKSAKYITAGSNQHRRSQLYTDAALGNLDAEELKAEITEKRNQEKLRCYPLIPIPEGHGDEALKRYEFIQRFLKESKQFGSQRRESERQACATAMENLAITTGFMDVNRMTWYLESEKMEEIRPLTEPAELSGSGVCVWLEIGEDGTASLAVEKNKKRQKSLPKDCNKNETVVKLKATIKELKEQKSRAKESLERAMTDGTEFGAEELRKILGNPVLAPMLRALVWTDGSENGFLGLGADAGSGTDTGETKKELILSAPGSGSKKSVTDKKLRVAHPHDLIQKGEWADYMHFLYEKKLVQPFKQVFREYYPLTEEERQEKMLSRRYAGHQVQPQRTVALLKGRGWTVDYEEGLQKVFYKENLIVRMYALADWFSPADIEAPTLETIRFYDRNTGKPVELEKVPPILFSEAMRDMDLVVSVAHVGGVDPEASHSTVEMRTAIAAELMSLLKLSNVEFIGSHAKIHGALSDYSVHMGSGVVHAQAVGMLAILPVHSQARGRIFLPFADEDPKTAEIMSKIILLAEDKKIKDPEILRQIHR